MAVTSTEIANQALQIIGDNQPAVTGTAPTFDSSPAGQVLQWIYAPTVQVVARQYGWDFARRTVALTLTGNAAPVPWTYEYAYPTSGVQVWSLIPAAPDANDPLPYNFNVANAVVSGSATRVIHTNLQNALAIYNNNPNENAWDAIFRQAVVDLLARVLAMALAGRPDLAKAELDAYSGFAQIGQARQD